VKKLLILSVLLTNTLLAQKIEKDKFQHFVAGAGISAVTYTMVYDLTESRTKATLFSIGTASAAGMLKELYDRRTGKVFDRQDLKYTIAGAIIPTVTLRITLGKGKKKEIIKK
jgi:uncharacterized protein YfiM (DUF2279 family)